MTQVKGGESCAGLLQSYACWQHPAGHRAPQNAGHKTGNKDPEWEDETCMVREPGGMMSQAVAALQMN